MKAEMTQERLTEIVTRLAKLFDVPVPEVRVDSFGPGPSGMEFLPGESAVTSIWTRHRDWWNPDAVTRVRITVTPFTREQSVRHEFAHYLVARVRGSGPVGDGGRGDESHDRIFYDMLIEVLRRDTGDPREHHWQKEYPHIQEWAKADGFYAPRPFLAQVGA